MIKKWPQNGFPSLRPPWMAEVPVLQEQQTGRPPILEQAPSKSDPSCKVSGDGGVDCSIEQSRAGLGLCHPCAEFERDRVHIQARTAKQVLCNRQSCTEGCKRDQLGYQHRSIIKLDDPGRPHQCGGCTYTIWRYEAVRPWPRRCTPG